MTEDEIFEFLEKVKAYYQHFSLDKKITKEWLIQLSKYDKDDVYAKFEQHLNGDYRNEIPKIHYITKFLKTKEQKKLKNQYNVRCHICNEVFNYNCYVEHIERHNSVYYLKSREKYFNQNLSEEKLMKLSQDKFDSFYDKFIEKLYELLPNSVEKFRIKNIIFSKSGMPIEISPKEMFACWRS